jgi:hypothetical protein
LSMPFDLLAYNPAPTTALQEYGRYLLSRLSEAVTVSRVEVALPDWTPAANRCHDNCQYYALNGGVDHKVASGWFVMDQRMLLGHVRFFSHSVMAPTDDPATWYDITPGDRLEAYPFLYGNLTAIQFKEFDNLLMQYLGACIFDVCS